MHIPPPITTTSGIKVFITFIRPSAIYFIYCLTTFSPTSSPCFAASKAVFASILEKSPSMSLFIIDCGFSSAAFFVCLINAVADAYASQHPFLPQVHCSPSQIITECPSSDPAKLKPLYILPSIITPPPIPVPSVIVTECFAPFALPATPSASAAQFASLSSNTGRLIYFCISALNGTFLKLRLPLKTSIPSSQFGVPGLPIPIFFTSSILTPAPLITLKDRSAISFTISV
ncbi:MAG: hypothetical protein BWY74_02484 [Firmicutes bacterium ADurb.Bin419]|nr:MAG: hypothetical protein BWY74_02484 [Firmicutes bacterium ADurb.Bin419]